jgi:hypothetical protein
MLATIKRHDGNDGFIADIVLFITVIIRKRRKNA